MAITTKQQRQQRRSEALQLVRRLADGADALLAVRMQIPFREENVMMDVERGEIVSAGFEALLQRVRGFEQGVARARSTLGNLRDPAAGGGQSVGSGLGGIGDLARDGFVAFAPFPNRVVDRLEA